MAIDSSFEAMIKDRQTRLTLRTMDRHVAYLVEQACPVGTVRGTIKDTADEGWLLDNQAITGCPSRYPKLWAVAPAGWKSGTTLTIPDGADAQLGGHGTNGIGTVVGSNQVTITTAQLPAHDHSITHTHTISHTHKTNVRPGWSLDVPVSGGRNTAIGTSQSPASSTGEFSTDGSSATNSGPSSASTTGDTGSGSSLNVEGKQFSVRFQVKHDYI